jgi:hypothetical protein
MSWTMKSVIASAFTLALLAVAANAAAALGMRVQVNACYQDCGEHDHLQLRLTI